MRHIEKIIPIALILIFLCLGPAISGTITPQSDLIYLGAFRIDNNPDWGIRVGTGLTYYPNGDHSGSNDGFPGSLFVVKRPYVFEISIPAPVISKNPEELPVASILSGPRKITCAALSNEPFWTQNPEFNILGDIAYIEGNGNGRPAGLFWSEWKYYNAGGMDYNSLGWSTLDMSSTYGLWHVGPKTEEFHGNRSGAYLFTIDKDWAVANLNGRYLATGRHRPNGAFGGSKGPTLFVMSPWEGNKPPDNGAIIDSTALIYYTSNDQFPNYSPVDDWIGASWVGDGQNNAVLIAGLKGTGSCYGEATSVNPAPAGECYDLCNQNKGFHGYPMTPRLLWYSADDLAKVLRGEKKPWEVVPYSEWTPSDVLMNKDKCPTGFGGAAFDKTHRLLYIVERNAYKVGYQAKSIIHVWKVNSVVSDDMNPPHRFDAQPIGDLSPGTTQTTISLDTNEPATCKYSETPGISYSSMQGIFSTTGGTNHSTTISGLTDGKSYNYYVKCEDAAGNANTSDYNISFSVKSASSASNVITVSNVNELQNAISNLQSNMEIVIQDGVYSLTQSLVIGGVQHVVIRGSSGNRDHVVLRGPGMANGNYGNAGFGIVIRNAQDVVIQDLTVEGFYYHDIMIKSEEGASRITLRNLHLKDAGEQIIKVTAAPNQASYCDNGVVENCLIEYTDRARNWYTNGLDALAVKDWIVRNNTFRNIRAPAGQLAGPAILFWQNSIGTIIERNKIINCDRGIAFGDSSGPGQYARNGETTYDHQGGIIRNNFVYRDQPGDVGISVNKAKDFKILNNTVILNGTFPWTIEYRFSSSNGIVANNLTDGPIQARDGAQATLVSNITYAQTGWFEGISSGNLHLTSLASAAIDHATAYPDVSDDIDGQSRGTSPDVGADEYNSGSSSTLPPPSTVTAVAANSIDLSWSGVSGAVGYNIYRSTTSGAGYTKINGQAPVTGTSYIDKNTNPGTTYYYVVTSVDSAGHESSYSKEVFATEPSNGGNQAPVISSFTAVPNPANNPHQKIDFAVQASDPDGDALSYTIAFGDGSSSNSGSTITHAYSTKGTYTAQATVSDNQGHSVSKSIQVIVNDAKPAKVKSVKVQ